ncbi:glycosyltransferase [Frankia casuarinae]|uniref:Glycosyl transferase, group 1 n=1 Tax=Frankia casuarinae (strain DSM 45818 / CECT 9043 / HFP020203 / CcI3) TaxID=106370 RepID=Q2JBQ9_FRACC|nr:glycosyl transferase, group 1 [Frankia casuarinae]ETA00286.1 glycosyltransferase [Frankia sp. CcI6]EYT90120.1 glycosyltransferase [Frankia casuarinae]KDA41052.1 glycosyltransferase [Frankia sp. BMG5.23]OAA18736.1 phosphatidylinositol alpha 1,6-mannosyltransferase [Frankia casuarinae]
MPCHRARVRIAVITESFLPHVDGVTNTVCRVLEHLRDRQHEAMVIAPAPAPAARRAAARSHAGAPVLWAPSAPLPGYPAFRFAVPWPGLPAALREFNPDIVHLAAPAGLGAQAVFAARRLGIPSIAVYQTDIAAFAARYGLATAERTIWHWLAIVHRLAARTLAPSWDAVDTLLSQGVQRVARWSRGVDLERFHPAHRDDELRRRLAPNGEVLVGYVGRLAREKRVELLGAVSDIPNTRLVVVGDGPSRPTLARSMPNAAFLGFRAGQELSAAVASLDVFVHTGIHETFCQAAQEAKASGVPVVAPAAGGLLDVVEHGRTGLHYTPGDPAALRAQVAALTDDLPRRVAMGAAARESVAGCGWSAIGDELLGHYRDVLGTGGGAGRFGRLRHPGPVIEGRSGRRGGRRDGWDARKRPGTGNDDGWSA